MELNRKDDFLKKSADTLGEIYGFLEKLPELALNELDNRRTALFIVDMVNGFAREGALKSPRVEGLIPEISKLLEKCSGAGIPCIAFADSHTEVSPEFSAYPAHCIAGTSESEVVDEIMHAGGYILIAKNSTNGFLEDELQNWLNRNIDIDSFIVTGDCTDICIQQFAVTLKTWFNRKNRKSRVIVPVNAVDTYDLGMHNADLMNVMALYNMTINGVEIVKQITDNR